MEKRTADRPMRALRKVFLFSGMLSWACILNGGCAGDTCWVEIKEFRSGDAIGPIWGLSHRDIYICADGGVYHFDGEEWRELPDFVSALDIWGMSNEDIFFAHLQGILHFDGTNWREMLEGGPEFSAIWGSSVTDVFAAAWRGTRIFHYDGTGWEEMALPASDAQYQFLEAIWGASGRDVYAVGNEDSMNSTVTGKVLYYDGISWEEAFRPGELSSFYDVWGAGKNDAFVVGDFGDIYHFNGSQWSKMETGMGTQFRGVWGTSGDSVFVVGASHVLHYDGMQWAEVGPGSGYSLYDVWGSSETNVYTVGCKLVDDGNDLFCGEGVLLRNTCSLDQMRR